MIDERSLKLNVYEYFKYCKTHHNIRGVAVVTDKQYVFYSQVLDKDYKTHNEIAINIEKAIHPDSNREGWNAYRKNNAYVYSEGTNLIINLPDNDKLSKTQLSFLLDILEQVDKYHQEVEDSDKKINLNLFGKVKNHSIFDQTDTSKIKQVLNEVVTKEVTIDEEKIIGKTLSKDEIKTNLLYHIGLDSCTNIKELVDGLVHRCSKYYDDSYYHDIFGEVFPDYIEIMDTIPFYLLRDQTIASEKIQNVTFENVKNMLFTAIESLFKNKHSYNEIKNIVSIIENEMSSAKTSQNKLRLEMLKKLFPNFELVSDFIFGLIPHDKEREVYIDSQLNNVNSYEELAKAVFRICYDEKSSELLEKENALLIKKEKLEDIKMKENIIFHKDKLNELITKKNELECLISKYSLEVNELEDSIDEVGVTKNNHDKVIADNSDTLLNRILNRKKIKASTGIVNESNSKIEELRLKKERLLKEIDNIKEDILLIEVEFKSISNLDYFPDSTSSIQTYYTLYPSANEFDLREQIYVLEKEISILKQEQEKLVQIGLIITGNEEVADSNEKMTVNYQSGENHY